MARRCLHKAQAEGCLLLSWFIVLFHCLIVYLSCSPALHDIFHNHMAQYSLFVLKMPLNTNQPFNLITSACYNDLSVLDHVVGVLMK